jgi:Holliday junction resolvase RusA-like endonuclease
MVPDPKYKKFKKEFHDMINMDLAFVENLKEYNDPNYTVKLHLNIGVPLDKFYTKKGTINKRGGDLSNYIKAVEDCLFSHTGLDDSQVIELNVQKHPDITGYSIEILFIVYRPFDN